MHERIKRGDQVFLKDGGDAVGAVRDVRARDREIVVNIENGGDFTVRAEAIRAVHANKVLLDFERLERALKDAVRHAHDAESE
jgi:hypothetical protein